MKKGNYNLKAFFSKLLSAKFTTAKVVGSETEVEYAENAVGVEVYVKGEGSTPATDGQYDLESGDSFIVADGKISEVLATFSDEDEDEKVEIIIDQIEEEKEKHSKKRKMSAEDEDDVDAKAINLSDEDVKTIVEQLAETIKADVIEAVREEQEEFKKKFMRSLKTTKANFSAVKTEEKEDKWAAFARASKNNK